MVVTGKEERGEGCDCAQVRIYDLQRSVIDVLYRYIVATVVCTCTVPRTPLARQNAYLYIPVAAPSAGHYEFRLLFIDILVHLHVTILSI